MPSAKKPAAGARRVKKTTARPAAQKKPAKHAAATPKAAGASGHSEAGPGNIPESPQPRAREPRVQKPLGATITIVQYVSGIACPVRQKRVLRALGLRHPHHRVVRPDNPAVRGMVKAIPHLVRIEEGERGA
jgi:large subunit ribosomal protein L30